MYRHSRLFEDAASDVADYKKQNARYKRQSNYVLSRAEADMKSKESFEKDLGDGFVLKAWLNSTANSATIRIFYDDEDADITGGVRYFIDKSSDEAVASDINIMLASAVISAAAKDVKADRDDIAALLVKASNSSGKIGRVTQEDLEILSSFYSAAAKHAELLAEFDGADLLDEVKDAYDESAAADKRFGNAFIAYRNRSDKVDAAKYKAYTSLNDEGLDSSVLDDE